MSLPRYESYKDWDNPAASIPRHWDVSRLDRIATINDDTLPEDCEPTREIEYVDIGSVTLDRGIHQTQQFVFSSAPSRARRLVRVGDIIVSTVRTYLKAIAPIAQGQGHLVVSTGFAVVRPKKVLASGFAKYALQSPKFVHDVISRSTGVSYPAINASDLARIDVPTPPFDEQSAIAAFLDRETAKIDALIAEQERLLQIVAEKRQAVISHAVTKGLNPDAPMKDSGVAWLGDVPAHWGVMPIRLAARLESGHTPSRSREDWWENCTVPWFSLADIWQIRQGADVIYETSEKVSELGLANSSARVLPKGTVMLSRTASVGFSAIMGVDMATTQDFANWICGPRLSPDFLLWVFRSMQGELRRLMMGSTHNTIYMPDIQSLRFALPPIEEQGLIVTHVRDSLRAFAELESGAKRGIELLKERRSALIAAAVTGQIDVRDVV
jgi:type I restriction enzyme S subunit